MAGFLFVKVPLGKESCIYMEESRCYFPHRDRNRQETGMSMGFDGDDVQMYLCQIAGYEEREVELKRQLGVKDRLIEELEEEVGRVDGYNKTLAEDIDRVLEENKRLRAELVLQSCAVEPYREGWLQEKVRVDKFKTLINDASVLIGNAGEILAESDDNTRDGR